MIRLCMGGWNEGGRVVEGSGAANVEERILVRGSGCDVIKVLVRLIRVGLIGGEARDFRDAR